MIVHLGSTSLFLIYTPIDLYACEYIKIYRVQDPTSFSLIISSLSYYLFVIMLLSVSNLSIGGSRWLTPPLTSHGLLSCKIPTKPSSSLFINNDNPKDIKFSDMSFPSKTTLYQFFLYDQIFCINKTIQL